MCYYPTKTTDDAPCHLNEEEARAWVIGYEQGFEDAMQIVSERDAGEDV